ncbi:MAG: IS110 family transposase [Actinomycetia bacterium]|nr:IS110 family transposase [Actinomycetes bacterium]
MTDPTTTITGGVDTHKHTHVAAALNGLGQLLATESFPATGSGYRTMLAWLTGFGTVEAVGVEGTGAWGAGLARHLTSEGVQVIEVQRPNRQHRRAPRAHSNCRFPSGFEGRQRVPIGVNV